MKKIYLSQKDKKFGGVLGGIGEYFDIDSTLIRLAFLIVMLLTGFAPLIIFYIVAWIIMPEHGV